jgi:hypothetical protein
MVTYFEDTLWMCDLCLGQICCSKICTYRLLFLKCNVHHYIVSALKCTSAVLHIKRCSVAPLLTRFLFWATDAVAIFFSIIYTKGNKETKIVTRNHVFVFVCVKWCPTHILVCLWCFSFVCVRSMLPVCLVPLWYLQTLLTFLFCIMFYQHNMRLHTSCMNISNTI